MEQASTVVPEPTYDTLQEWADTILFNIEDDPGETRNVAAAHPDIVKRLSAMADAARRDLGDSQQKMTGSGVRKPGFDASAGE